MLQGVQGEIDDPPGFMDLQRRRGADHEEYDRHNAYDKGPGLVGLSDVELDRMNAGYDDLDHLRAGYKGMPGRFHTKLSLSLTVGIGVECAIFTATLGLPGLISQKKKNYLIT